MYLTSLISLVYTIYSLCPCRCSKNNDSCIADVYLFSMVGSAPAHDHARMEQLINKLQTAMVLAKVADERLLRTIIFNPSHVLKKHFIETRCSKYNLLTSLGSGIYSLC